MLVSEIINKLPEDWDKEDLSTVVAMLRKQASEAEAAEAQALATGKKVRTKAPTFTKNRPVAQDLPAELDNMELDLS